VADRMVTLGKEGTEHARRRAFAVVRGAEVVNKLFGELAQRYAGRTGGYTRVLQTRRRVGDGAHMAYIEYVGRPGELREAMPQPQPALAAQEQEWARQRAGLAAAAKLQRLVGPKSKFSGKGGPRAASPPPQAQQ
jgi:large subunit ribosomal protein L17